MKPALIIVTTIFIIAGGVFLMLHFFYTPKTEIVRERVVTPSTVAEETVPIATSSTPHTQPNEPQETSTLGKSLEGREIMAHHYGSGEREILLIAGIHGGYAANTTMLAQEMMGYFSVHPEKIPQNITLTIIPTINPDGLYKTTGTNAENLSINNLSQDAEKMTQGRFNANNVDLNRNFDCAWSTTSMWQNIKVSGGTEPFSEPESKAIQQYITQHKPEAVLVWYTSAGGVYSSNCKNGVSEDTKTLTNIFADASGYPAYEEFNYYEITGDMVNWFAKQNIPAISILLTTAQETEFEKNIAGVEATLLYTAR